MIGIKKKNVNKHRRISDGRSVEEYNCEIHGTIIARGTLNDVSNKSIDKKILKILHFIFGKKIYK